MPLFLTILLIGILSGSEVDLFIPSFPELQKVYNLSPFMVQLTLSVNFISYCVCSLFAGALGDHFNRKIVMLWSLTIFVLGSLFCVFSANFWMLLIGRFLQGAGMAGPAVLGYVIIADKYPIEKQPAMLGLLNGIVTLAMAFAPVIGSYVNLFFSWRGNFVILLSLGLICLIISYFVIPNKKGNLSTSLSPKAYWPLLTSKKLMIFTLGICVLVVPYWIFISMAPILYMEDMGVELKHFGFYQGAIAGAFSLISIISPKILKRFGQKNCLIYSKILCLISAILMLVIALLDIHHPLTITAVMLIFTMGIVFPINILYPMCLEVVEDAKSRTAALINSLRLLLSAIFLELISFFYIGEYYHLGLTNAILTFIGVIFIIYLFKKGWVHFESTEGNKGETTIMPNSPRS